MLSVFVQFLKVQTDVMRFLSHYLHMVFIPIKLSEEYYMPPCFWSSNYKKTHAKNSPKPGYIKSLNTPGLKYWTNWSLNSSDWSKLQKTVFLFHMLLFYLQLWTSWYETPSSLFWWTACLQCTLCQPKTLYPQSSPCGWKVLCWCAAGTQMGVAPR